jgi:hypothetical protein
MFPCLHLKTPHNFHKMGMFPRTSTPEHLGAVPKAYGVNRFPVLE